MMTRINHVFGRTLREAPAEVRTVSGKLAVRAALIQWSHTGRTLWLPLGMRVAGKLSGLMVSESKAQEIAIPGDEEPYRAVLDAAATQIASYKQLPQVAYRFGRLLVGDGGPSGGIWRSVEPLGLEMYGFLPDRDAADRWLSEVVDTFGGILRRLGLNVFPADVAPASHERLARALMWPCEFGEAKVVKCAKCGYAALEDVAESLPPSGPDEQPGPLTEIATPGCKTIAEVAAYVGVDTSQTLKAVFYVHNDEDFIFCLLRGDREINEAKLLRLLGGGALRAATEDEIMAVGTVPGYASPAGLTVRAEGDAEGVIVIADRSITMGANFVVGAHKEGYHMIGANYPRDFSVTRVTDIAAVSERDTCIHCSSPLTVQSATAIGRISAVKPDIIEASGARYLGSDGRHNVLGVGALAIDFDALLAAVLERHNDEHGIIWPKEIAPFDVHIIALGSADEVLKQAAELYNDLRRAGIDVLLDDRKESAGVKFADADLLGIPIRVTVSKRTLAEGAVEMKARDASEREMVSTRDIIARLSTSARY